MTFFFRFVLKPQKYGEKFSENVNINKSHCLMILISNEHLLEVEPSWYSIETNNCSWQVKGGMDTLSGHSLLHWDSKWTVMQFGTPQCLGLAKLMNIIFGKFIAILRNEKPQSWSKSSHLMFVLFIYLLELRIFHISTGFYAYKIVLNLTSLFFSQKAKMASKVSVNPYNEKETDALKH